MKKAIFLVLFAVQACEAQQDTADQTMEKECEKTYDKCDQCSFQPPSYEISAILIPDDDAEDE